MSDHPAALQLLLQLTSLPTAAGREQRVVAHVRQWVRNRPRLKLRADNFGNLLITRRAAPAKDAPPPLFFTAHLDHPAFVVTEVRENRLLRLAFRGGVADACFEGKTIEIVDRDDTVHRARILELEKTTPDRHVIAQLGRSTDRVQPGDIARWRFSGPGGRLGLRKGMLYAHACDDLAGVAAALDALDRLLPEKAASHVGVLLTRAEEVGFLGAIAAARDRFVPREARLLCLENSRSFPESPIGSGPILRVGDRIGVFSPRLTNHLTALFQEEEKRNPGFRWQRKLMPGGVCEATVFSEYGYESTCLCLPLGHYHNMTDASLPPGAPPTGGVGPEFIAIDDYRGLVDLLCLAAARLDTPGPTWIERWEDRLLQRQDLFQ